MCEFWIYKGRKMDPYEIMQAHQNMEVSETELYRFNTFDEYLRVRANQGVKK
jgi:hypothetical protein